MNLKVNRFCAPCNRVFMGEGIEVPTQPILAPMLEHRSDERLFVSKDHQRILATWAYKTALTTDFVLRGKDDPDTLAISSETYQGFRARGLPPRAGAFVWLGTYGGNRHRASGSRVQVRRVPFERGRLRADGSIVARIPDGAPVDAMFITTLSFAQVVFRIAGPIVGAGSVPPTGFGIDDRFAQIWPLSGHPVVWPSEVGTLDEADLLRVAD
jgi:hypothetical protein